MLNTNEIFGAYCYHNKKSREWVATTMLYKSIKIFYKTNTIRTCETLYQLFSSEKDPLKLHKNSTRILKEIKDPLLDIIAITIAYENYFKSVLLLKGYVIHEIIKNMNESLAREQKRHPILISRLKIVENVFRKRKIDYSFSLLNYKTVSISQLLNAPDYKNKLNITSEVLGALKRIIVFRNSLHFIVGENGAWNENILLDYKRLLEYANTNFLKNYNRLAKRITFFTFCEYDKDKCEIKFLEGNA